MVSHLPPQFPDLLNFYLRLPRLAVRADLPVIRMAAGGKKSTGAALTAGILV
jgi:hypothetical protein